MKRLAVVVTLALLWPLQAGSEADFFSGIDVEKLAPVAEAADAVDCGALAAACNCAEKSDPPGNIDGAVEACERAIAGRLRDYSSDLRWARLFVAGTGSPRLACMTNQLADASFPGGRGALWDALGLDAGHWRRTQDVCWRR